MKKKQVKTEDKQKIWEEIMRAEIASFRIEGIYISEKEAVEILKKVVANLKK